MGPLDLNKIHISLAVELKILRRFVAEELSSIREFDVFRRRLLEEELNKDKSKKDWGSCGDHPSTDQHHTTPLKEMVPYNPVWDCDE